MREPEQIELYLAMQAPEFGVIMDADPVLAELEAQRYDKTEEFFDLMAIFRSILRVGGVSLQPLTPAAWAFLWSIDNAYPMRREPSTLDTDIFFYVLSRGVQSLPATAAELIDQAAGFCAANGLDYAESERDAKSLIHMAHRPLEMLPPRPNTGKELRLDAYWLTSLAASIADVTNHTAEYIIFEMPLTVCMYYYLQAVRRAKPDEVIERRAADELSEAIYKRTEELGREYWRSLQGGENVR